MLLDLTSLEAAAVNDRAFGAGSSAGRGIGVSSGALFELPASLTIEPLERDDFSLGERSSVELRIRNAGKVPLVLPWSPKALLLGDSTDEIRAIVSLVARTRGGADQIGAWTLYGSESMPSSVQVLKPGQEALIRVPVKWIVADAVAAEIRRGPPEEIELMAEYRLTGQGPSTGYMGLRSRNTRRAILRR